MTDDPLYVMTTAEVVIGYPLGSTGSPPPSDDSASTPREALEREVRIALARPPCGVAFSGGRDSSTVLAIATHVARRDGLAEPVPIAGVFPAAPRAEETQWQEAVVRHLGLRDWQRIRMHDELDLVGPLATPGLLAHGVVWPPLIHVDIPLLELLEGGSLLDGEGGDEVLGVRSRPAWRRWRI